MAEKTKRTRSIYTVNEKSAEVTPSATPPETAHTGCSEVPSFKSSFVPYERKAKDYTPEWRRGLAVGSYGDYNRGPVAGFPSAIPNDLSYHSSMTSQDHVQSVSSPGMAMATPHGTMSLLLRNDIKVDMSLDSSIRLINKRNSVVVALNPYGCISAFIHPHGRIYQNGSKVEMLIYDCIGGFNKNAKMWYKGVSFGRDYSALVYLVDAAGTRSTTDSFRDLTPDFSLPVFYEESRHGPLFVQEAVATLQKATYWITETGVENWRIKDIFITQSGDVINVYRKDNKYQLKITGDSTTAMLSTPFIHCTASAEHMFVRRGDRRMHFDGANFIVRNAGHSAGFDEYNELKIF